MNLVLFSIYSSYALRAPDIVSRGELVDLSDHGWRLFTVADQNVVGKTLQLSGDDFIVVGVMPAGFVGLDALPPQYWVSNAHYAPKTCASPRCRFSRWWCWCWSSPVRISRT